MSSAMIDWITALFPCQHAEPVSGGMVCAWDQAGELLWRSDKYRAVEGSHSAVVQVRSADASGSRLYVSGNAVKFLQGHNLFGSGDLVALGFELYRRIVQVLGLTPTDFEWESVKNGWYELKRVDCTSMVPFDSNANVQAYLRAATGQARGRHQGVSAYGGETVYIGQHSRRITTKLYNKLQELSVHPLPLFKANCFQCKSRLLRKNRNTFRQKKGR